MASTASIVGAIPCLLQKPTWASSTFSWPVRVACPLKTSPSGRASGILNSLQNTRSKRIMRNHNPIAWLTDRATSKIGRWVTLALWLAVAGALAATAPQLSKLYDNKATTSIGNPESVQAQNLLNQAFPKNTGIPAIIVLNDANGLTSSDQQTADHIACWLLSADQRAATKACAAFTYAQARPDQLGPVVAVTNIPQAKSQLVSGDGTTETIIASIDLPSSDSLGIQNVIKQMRAYTDTFASSSLQVKVT